MNKTILAKNDGVLLESLIVKYGKVVTTKQIYDEASESWSDEYTKQRIRQLVAHGWLIRVKRGLYVISDLSSRGFLSVSPYAIAHLLVEVSYVSFEAALAYHGMFDQFTHRYISVSLRQYKTVDLDSIQYRFVKTQKKMFIGWETVEIDNLTAQIANAEKSLVDIIHFRKSQYAVDLVIEKLRDYDVDLALLYQYASNASQITVKIFGLILDWLGMDSSNLYDLIQGKNSTHWINAGDTVFNAKWRLYYDAYFDKYKGS